MTDVDDILKKNNPDENDLAVLLSCENDAEIEKIRAAAIDTLLEHVGPNVFMRGLVEFSNYCTNDCYYCGLRKGNHAITRYMLGKEEVAGSALQCLKLGYGSLVLQSGERNDSVFIDQVIDLIRTVKSVTKCEEMPEGLGLTLCVGEQTLETYRRFFEAGAHRYLLRIETTNRELYSRIHPPEMSFDRRVECLGFLREAGFQVGTGVMIGLPGQTAGDLARDITFFRDMDIDMIGMGPYLIEHNTPMNAFREQWLADKERITRLGLKMIAVTRLALKDVNIASTTALQTITENGKEKGLLYGANVIMPLLTPEGVREEYSLYDGKPNQDLFTRNFYDFLKNNNRVFIPNYWGDPKHFANKNK